MLKIAYVDRRLLYNKLYHNEMVVIKIEDNKKEAHIKNGLDKGIISHPSYLLPTFKKLKM